MSKPTGDVGSFQRAARNVEDAFFLEQDALLVKKLQAMKQLAETKEALASVSGIADDAVLSRLVELEVKPETVAALAAVPLVEVAWADGSVSPEEAAAVLEHASAHGVAAGTVERELLQRWLTHRPEPRLLEAWQAYVRGLCGKLSPAETATLRESLLRSTRATAQSSGGFLGMGRISAAEQKVLDALAAAFG
jgi:hypothetical protein